jgi:predicted dienelactone hydrolase
VSAANDRVQQDPRFARSVDFTQVGVYGMSAGGHTAGVMAGASWRLADVQRHCLAHLAADFRACVRPAQHPRSGAPSAEQLEAARRSLQERLGDPAVVAHTDARVRAAVAAVPLASVLDEGSLKQLRVPLGVIQVGQDAWLPASFHSQRLLAACTRCELLADLPQAGHGSLLSPWPQDLAVQITPLLVDPPEFDRAALPAVYASVVAFFQRTLSAAK